MNRLFAEIASKFGLFLSLLRLVYSYACYGIQSLVTGLRTQYDSAACNRQSNVQLLLYYVSSSFVGPIGNIASYC